MRRIALGFAGAVALGAAVAGAYTLSRAPLDEAGERLVAGLRDATGLKVEANGRGAVSLFPTPKVTIAGVSLARRGEAPFAAARELTGSLRVGALLFGRVELSEISLSEPQIALDRAPFAEIASALRARTASEAPPSIRLSDARLDWNGGVVDRVEAGLVWPTAGGPMAISGYGRFAGRPVEASAQISDLHALANNRRAPIRIRLEGGGARVLFDGEAVDRGRPKLIGEISARAASVGDTLGWLGVRTPGKDVAGWSVSLAGHGVLDGSGLAVSNAEFDLSGKSFLGAGRVTATADGRPSVEATLDAGALDLKPFAAALLPDLADETGAWSAIPIDFGRLQGWTLDLRLSAAAVRLGRLRLGPTAATVAVANGGLDLSIGEASAYGGTLGGRLSVEPKGAAKGAAARIRLEGGGSDLAIDEALKTIMRKPPIEGALLTELAVEGEGSSIAQIVASLQGKASGHVTDGALEGVGRSRTLALAGLRGRMPFTSANARMTIEGGVARANDIAIVGPDATFALGGAASLVTRELKLKGSVRPAERGWALPVVVEGPLAAPRLRPDLSSRGPRGEASRSGADETVR